MTFRTRTIAAFLVAILLPPPGGYRPVLAADEAVLPIAAVVGLRGSADSTDVGLAEAVGDQLKASGRMRVTPEPVSAKYVEDLWSQQQKLADPAQEQALRTFAQGKKQYENLEIDEAIRTLNQAVKAYRGQIASLRDNRPMLLSHLYLGMALIIRGREAEGRGIIRQMVTLDPARELTKLPPRQFPPRIVSLHQKLTKEIVEGPSGEIVIRTDPSEASVYFDGVAQTQRTPLQIKKVPVGEHFVAIERKGYKRYSQPLDVHTGVNQILKPLQRFEPVKSKLVSQRTDLELLDVLSLLARNLGAQLLVLGDIVPSNTAGEGVLSGQWFDVRSKEFGRIERVETQKGERRKAATALTTILLRGLTPGGFIVRQPEVEDASMLSTVGKSSQQESDVFREPVYKRWWFWAAIGGVVAGGTAAAFLLQPSSPNYNVLTIQNPQ